MAFAPEEKPKVLVVFDFDSTLVEANCNQNYILKVLPELNAEDQGPNTMWELPSAGPIFPPELIASLDDIQFVSGMPELLTELAKNGHETIIISDNNSVFIGHTLKVAGLQNCVSRVFTNPSWYEVDGGLKMAQYHHQDWCQLCPVNLCKGHVLREYIRQRRSEGADYKFVAYVGDGVNDFCPALCLTEQDMVLPRHGYELDQVLKTPNYNNFKCKCKVVPWVTGVHVRRAISEALGEIGCDQFPFI